MSYRSALNNPTTSSGNVGQIVEVIISASPVTIPSGAGGAITTITLPPGTWHIDLALYIEITGTSSNGNLILELAGNLSPFLVFTKTAFPEKTTSTTSVELQIFDSLMLTVTTTTIYSYQIVNSTYTGGTMTYSNAGFGPTLLPTIRATKLA